MANKKNKKNLPKNGRQRNKNHSETIVIKGETYMRLYDEDGNVPEDLSMLDVGKDGIAGVIEELKAFGLMEVIERNGVEYCRTLEPKEQ